MKDSIQIPFRSDKKKGFLGTLKDASKKRNMNPFQLIFRRFKNNLLFKLSFHCKYNGLRIKMHRWRGVTIGNNVYIAKDCILDNSYPEFITIKDNVIISGGVLILTHSIPPVHFRNIVDARVSPVVIEEGVWLGTRSVVLRGVTVREKSIVSAGTIVDKNVRPHTIVRGNPMKEVVDISSFLE